MQSNIQKLGNTLAGRMQKTASANTMTTLELGTISSNMSLVTDSLRMEIPRGDYLVARPLAGGSTTSTYTDADGEAHSHSLPDAYRELRAKDRVLVAWCGNDPVVIAIVVSS